MKSNNKMLIGTSLMVAIILVSAYSYSSAYRGDSNKKGPNYSEERHAAMKEAFENNDYEAWKKLMEQYSKGRVLDVVTEDNFSKFAEAYKLAQEGKYDEARKIKEEMGLMGSRGNHRAEMRESIDEAFENNDYNAWKEVARGKRSNILEVINEDNFSRLAEAHKLMKEGSYEEAREIKSELGIEFEGRGGFGKGEKQGRFNR